MNTCGYAPRAEQCCFCSGSDLRPHSEATYWSEFDLHFVECAQCRLIFANPMPDLETIVRGNRALNIRQVSRGTISQYRGGKEFTAVLNRLKPDGVMLDVGCAEGLWLLGVEENSRWRAEGLEIVESAVAFATGRLGLTVHLGTIETMKSERAYDFIRMNNVIEHVQDPVVFLRAANRLLPVGGQVYCSTPNGFQDGHVLKTANRRGFRVNLLENHFFYYHPRTLAKLFAGSGFKVRRAWSEDAKHTLKDFGLIPRLKTRLEQTEPKLSDFQDRTNVKFGLSEEEIQSFRNHPAVSWWRLRLRQLAFQARFPTALPIGHQQHLFADKIQDA
jgi:2-polyprenyl-3-methyl-5-hydroxy-6-metoxy-1,4-benzoquinol methylase